MKIDVIECGSCLAPVKIGARKCEYCGAIFNIDWSMMDSIVKPRENAGYRVSIEPRLDVKLGNEEFTSTFVEKYRLLDDKRTPLIIALYKFDDDVLKDQEPLFSYDPISVPTFDTRKTGLPDLVKFIEMSDEPRLAFIDLFASINDAHVKKALSSDRPTPMSPGMWYARNIHLDNVINLMQYSGKESIVLFERVKMSINPKTGEDEMTFPASHKVIYRSHEIIDITSGQRMKSRDIARGSWNWRPTKMAAMELIPGQRW